MNKKEKESNIRNCIRSYNLKISDFLYELDCKLTNLLFDEKNLYHLYQEIKEEKGFGSRDNIIQDIYFESLAIKIMSISILGSLPIDIIKYNKDTKGITEIKESKYSKLIKNKVNQINNIHSKIVETYIKQKKD